jgi:6,7-dimethyl-8-ribityllumazine synthase
MAFSQNSKSLLDLSSLSSLNNAKVAIVKTEWNDKFVKLQMEGAEKIAQLTNATIIRTETVPGAVELPFGIRRLHEATQHLEDAPEAIIAFGLVVRGGTPHFEYVCQTATNGILQLNLSLPIPIIFGVLTLENELQAYDRLGGIHGHKGEEAMITALKMIQFNRKMSVSKS